METDPYLRQRRQPIFQVLGSSPRDIATGQSTVDPLRRVIVRQADLRPSDIGTESPLDLVPYRGHCDSTVTSRGARARCRLLSANSFIWTN